MSYKQSNLISKTGWFDTKCVHNNQHLPLRKPQIGSAGKEISSHCVFFYEETVQHFPKRKKKSQLC